VSSLHGSSIHGGIPGRRFLNRFKRSRGKPIGVVIETSTTNNSPRLQELEATLVQQQIQIAKLRRTNKGDDETHVVDDDDNESNDALGLGGGPGEPDADKAAGVLQEGDDPKAVSLSTEEAQELTIHSLMQKIEALEEDKADHAHSIESLRRTLELVQQENVSKSIRMEAMESNNNTNNAGGRSYYSSTNTSTHGGSGGSNEADALSQLKVTSDSYDETMKSLRGELDQLKQSLEEKAIESRSHMKQLAKENAELSVKISTLQSGTPTTT